MPRAIRVATTWRSVLTAIQRFEGLVVVLLAITVAVASIRYSSEKPDWLTASGGVFVIAVLIVSTLLDQMWIVPLTVILLSVILVGGKRSRHFVALAVLACWTAIHLLNFVSANGDWIILAFDALWLVLFALALIAILLRRRWEFLIHGLVLAFTGSAFLVTLFAPDNGAILPNRWLQQAGFRVYAQHLLRSIPRAEFLVKCKLVDYEEDGGARSRVGECSEGLRSTLSFQVVIIYDPSGQLAIPATQRSLAWRSAALRLPSGRSFVHDNHAQRLEADLFWVLASPDLSGDNRK